MRIYIFVCWKWAEPITGGYFEITWKREGVNSKTLQVRRDYNKIAGGRAITSHYFKGSLCTVFVDCIHNY